MHPNITLITVLIILFATANNEGGIIILITTHDEAMPLVEWARTPMGHCRPKEEYASMTASTIH